MSKATEIADSAETVLLGPGEFLFREGDLADALYIVRKGLLRIVSGSTVYETVRPGGIIGEMGIVEQGGRRSASIIAGTRSELEKIADSGGSRPRIRNDLARHSDLISLGVPR